MRPLALTQLALLSVGLVACHDVTGPSSIPTALLNIVDPDREPGRLSAVPGLSFRAQSKNWEPGHCQDSLATKPSPEAHARGARSSVNRPPAPRCRSEVAPPVGEPRTRLTSLRCRDSGRARLKKPRAVVDYVTFRHPVAPARHTRPPSRGPSRCTCAPFRTRTASGRPRTPRHVPDVGAHGARAVLRDAGEPGHSGPLRGDGRVVRGRHTPRLVRRSSGAASTT